mgnify:CR=1 FL=1|jgi:hypothetical protein
MKLTRTSPLSGKKNTLDIDVTREQITDWERGSLIQDAMPNLTPDEMEFIKTGITSEEWNELFGDAEEDF